MVLQSIAVNCQYPSSGNSGRWIANNYKHLSGFQQSFSFRFLFAHTYIKYTETFHHTVVCLTIV